MADNRLIAVRRLIEQVPDGAIRSLEAVLAGGGGDRSIATIHGMVNAEMIERRVRSQVFAPVAVFCEPNPHLVGRMNFPRGAPALAWRALKLIDEDRVNLALRRAAQHQAEEGSPEIFDELCTRVAAGLRMGEEPFAGLSRVLEAAGDGVAAKFIQAMSLTPLVRRALPKLPDWLRTLSGEYAAAIRLAFRDATAINEDAGPAFVEMLYGQLEEPWQVLRLISLVMDRPADRYLAGSELASFGTRLLDDIDRKIGFLRSFDPDRGLEAGVEAAAAAQSVICTVNEFDQWLAISRDGPWGKRLIAQKRSLAGICERLLGEADHAFTAALPTAPLQISTRLVRDAPDVTRSPDALPYPRAQALFAFLYETRGSAGAGGFGVARAKVAEALDGRVDQYVENLLEMLHEGRCDASRVRQYLDMGAELLSLVRDPSSAQIVRRRMAVA